MSRFPYLLVVPVVAFLEASKLLVDPHAVRPAEHAPLADLGASLRRLDRHLFPLFAPAAKDKRKRLSGVRRR